MKLKQILSLLFAFLVLGCTRFHVEVDSITDPSREQKKSYFLYPAMEGVSLDNLHFKEYSNYINKALLSQGYYATPLEQAEIVIFVRYGIGDPQTISYQYSVPIFGRTDPGTTTVTGTTYGPGGTSTTYATVTPKKRYGVVGTQTYSGTATSYFRYLVLDAIDYDVFKEDSTLAMLWNTTVTSSGSSGDLREVMPYLVVASAKYIGTNTGQRIEVQLRENDPEVHRMRTGQ